MPHLHSNLWQVMWISQLGGEVELEVLKFHRNGVLFLEREETQQKWATQKKEGDLHRFLFCLPPKKTCQVFKFSSLGFLKDYLISKAPCHSWLGKSCYLWIFCWPMFKHTFDWNLKPLKLKISANTVTFKQTSYMIQCIFKNGSNFRRKNITPVMFQEKTAPNVEMPCSMQLWTYVGHMINQ